MNLSKLIYDALSKQKDEPRNYIGASSIGNHCERAIWYGLHRPKEKEVTAQQRLTFEIGKKLESIIIDILRNHFALDVHRKHHCDEFPYFQGELDAVLFDPDAKQDFIIEVKTANDSSFNTFKNKGLRLWYPEYYDQIQSYMGMSGVHKCYLIAINKNTSELHDQLVLFDEDRYKVLVEKAKRIGEAVIEPPRINGSASYFRCKMCFYKNICHGI